MKKGSYESNPKSGIIGNLVPRSLVSYIEFSLRNNQAHNLHTKEDHCVDNKYSFPMEFMCLLI